MVYSNLCWQFQSEEEINSSSNSNARNEMAAIIAVISAFNSV